MATLIIDGEATAAQTGRTLFDHADSAEVRIPSSCPRGGKCHECIVSVISGMEALSPRSPAEEFLDNDFRLACQATVTDDGTEIEVVTLRRNRQIIANPGQRNYEVDPLTRREGDSVVFRGEPIDHYRGRILGIAADIGTTTIVLHLLNLESGEVLHTSAFENPQVFGGSDVMHRIQYEAEHEDHELQRVLLSYINHEIREMPCDRHEIYEFVVVGNSTMRDLFFGLDVRSIGLRPFKSLTEHARDRGESDSTSVYESPAALKLRMNKNGVVYGLPILGCHVGADTAGALLATELYLAESPRMLIDIGTNTEIVVGNRERILAASSPAGPAFEGGGVRFGMPGVDGAIESVQFDGSGQVVCRTIGGVPPRGLCGSGLIDLLAGLMRTGQINRFGRFTNHRSEFVLVEDGHRIAFSEKDINALAQAKSSNYCGEQILLKRYGITLDQVQVLYLSGGFANYIDPQSAIDIGLIPDLPLDRIVKVGNAAAEGAVKVLLSRSQRKTAEELARRIEHVELETDPEFFESFVDGCQFAKA